MKDTISFSIPCYNSAKTIKLVIDEIRKIIKDSKYDYEIVAVVDGSPDNVYDILKSMAKGDSRIKVINLSKNFGQANARIATLRYVTGKYIVCMDDDGQCPMEHLFELIEPLENGKDVSIADYPKKKQSGYKNFGSKLNRIMAKLIIDMPKGFRMSNFFAMQKYVAKRVVEYPNPYPYMTGLLTQITHKFQLVPMEERERLEGKTGYTFRKLVSFWLNGFTSFSVRPLRISSFVGSIFAIVGFIYGIVIIIRKILNANIVIGYSSLIAAIMLIGGILMIMLGLIGEYIGRMYISMNNAPQYVVRNEINVDK